MKTYLHAPQCPQNELEEILSARNDIRHALRSSRNSRGCLENLFGMLRPFFPVSFLLITEPRDIEEQRRLHVYPQVGGRDILSGTYEREYLRAAAAVSHGPMVRIGNQDDHAITIALLRNSLPRRRFSILFFRNTFADGKFAVFGIVAQGEGRFQEIHCARMFALVDLFSEYWKSGRGGKKTAARRHDPGYLELENLPGMQKTLHMLWMAGRQDFPVLLLGETGTGKEVAANIVHRCSARHGGAFVKMNCGNIPENLVDSELFGHEKGAFTGADAMHRGRFERADRGVLLLDELGELPLTAQACRKASSNGWAALRKSPWMCGLLPPHTGISGRWSVMGISARICCTGLIFFRSIFPRCGTGRKISPCCWTSFCAVSAKSRV